MANFGRKNKETVEITKTAFWLNVETPLGKIGINLASGIDQHEKLIAVCNEYGAETTSKWLQSKGFNGYITQEGKTSEFDVKSLADEMKSLAE